MNQLKRTIPFRNKRVLVRQSSPVACRCSFARTLTLTSEQVMLCALCSWDGVEWPLSYLFDMLSRTDNSVIPVLKCRFFHNGGHFPRFGSATTCTYLPKKIRKLHLSKGSLVGRHTNLSPTRRANQDLEISVQTSGTPHRQKTSFKPRRLGYVYDTALTPKTAGLRDWIADNHVAKQAFSPFWGDDNSSYIHMHRANVTLWFHVPWVSFCVLSTYVGKTWQCITHDIHTSTRY